MKIIKERLKLNPFTSKALNFYFGGKTFAVFDIETTGLNPKYCNLMLSGIIRVKGSEGELIQYFAESLDEEPELLRRTIADLSETDYVLTYNGRHFDIPFIKKRAAEYGINSDSVPYTLDLYLVLNGYSPFKTFLPDLKQKTVEVFMGLASSRDDKISGKENVDMYNAYLETRSPALREKILLHNHDDLIQLYKLQPVISKTDFHRAMFSLGFPLKYFTIKKIYTSGRDLKITGSQNRNPVDYISFPTEEDPYTLTMTRKDRAFELTIPGFNESGYIVSDIYALLGEKSNKLKEYPDVVNGYLITSTPEGLNHFEINAFAKVFLDDVLPAAIGLK